MPELIELVARITAAREALRLSERAAALKAKLKPDAVALWLMLPRTVHYLATLYSDRRDQARRRARGGFDES